FQAMKSWRVLCLWTFLLTATHLLLKMKSQNTLENDQELESSLWGVQPIGRYPNTVKQRARSK
ncbi:hypothetical protein SK128_028053, partial [Halocaridina rubra]